MARRSLRTQSSSVASTPQKRPHPEATPVQQSKRSKANEVETTLRITPKKSPHFKSTKKQEDEDESDAFAASPSPSSSEGEASGYEDEDASAVPSSSESEVEEDSSDDARPKKKKGQTPKATSTSTPIRSGKGQQLWRPGVKAGLGPGTQVVIDLPKPRDPGKTKYTDDTIHPNTMLFLKDLAANNDREWLKMYDPDYRQALKDFNSFLESLQVKIMAFDYTVPELPIKDVVFRIYRDEIPVYHTAQATDANEQQLQDVRFSKDQTPYKTHFSAAWSRTGRKGPFAAYYMQIKPGGSFIGGGLWCPEAQPVAALRQDINREPHKIKDALKSAGIRREFLGNARADDKTVVKAFVAKNKERALKTKPKGFDGDHPDIDLLRLRDYTLGRRLEDKEVLGPGALDHIASIMQCLTPFVMYLNSVVMPDDDEEANGDEQRQATSDDESS